MKKGARRSGIDAVGSLPWGTHLCVFYQTQNDLMDILGPFFRAGLEDNEFCMWIVAPPLNAEEARKRLVRRIPDLDRHLKQGQIEILDTGQWYTPSGKFEADQVLEAWSRKEKQAFQKGFDGLRVSGDSSWLDDRAWKDYSVYEERVNHAISGYRMLAVCSYPLDKCGASEVFDVIQSHQSALARRKGRWEILEASCMKTLRARLEESESLYKDLVEKARAAIAIEDEDGNIRFFNERFADLFGYSLEEMKTQSISSLVHPDDRRRIVRFHKERIQGKNPPSRYEFRGVRKDGSVVEFEVDALPLKEGRKIIGTRSYLWDITEQKKVARELEKKMESLEKFQKLAVGRELRMIELKEKIRELEARLAQKTPEPSSGRISTQK